MQARESTSFLGMPIAIKPWVALAFGVVAAINEALNYTLDE